MTNDIKKAELMIKALEPAKGLIVMAIQANGGQATQNDDLSVLIIKMISTLRLRDTSRYDGQVMYRITPTGVEALTGGAAVLITSGISAVIAYFKNLSDAYKQGKLDPNSVQFQIARGWGLISGEVEKGVSRAEGGTLLGPIIQFFRGNTGIAAILGLVTLGVVITIVSINRDE